MFKEFFSRYAISRRAALLGGSATVAVAAAGGVRPAQAQPAGHDSHAGDHPGALGSRIRTPAERLRAAQARNAVVTALTGDPLPVPPVVRVAAGTTVPLGMKPQSYQLGGRPARNLRVYDNGSAPQYLMGPTLEFGQTGAFGVRLVNNLDLNKDQDQPHLVNIPSQFNTTNLHTHGLHVSPSGNGDNVYIEVLPAGTDAKYGNGETAFIGQFDYLYTLSGHTPGTFWYHPHRHGSVAVQVASGAAGALIVRGGEGTVDAVPGIKGVTEQVLLLQQVVLNQDGELPDFDTLWASAGSGAKAEWTVNGTVGATLTMQPGEVQRWRIVNTGFQASAKFALFKEDGAAAAPVPVPVTLIAMDGVNFTKTAVVEGVYLPPGGRADILVQAPAQAARILAKAGGYVNAKIPTGGNGLSAGFEIDGVWQEALFVEEPTVLFQVAVTGTPKPMPLPSGALPKPSVPDIAGDTTPDGYRSVIFDVTQYSYPEKTPSNGLQSYDPGATPTVFKFPINDELFCPGRVMFQPALGTVDQYTVSSPGLHVFHIHVNPFLVTQVDGRTLSTPMWRDTMLAGPNGYVALTRYTDYTGTFPIHCHILDHEDVGMMTNVSVVDGPGKAAALPGHGGHKPGAH